MPDINDAITLRHYLEQVLAEREKRMDQAFHAHEKMHITHDRGLDSQHHNSEQEIARLRNRVDSLEQSRANLDGKIAMMGMVLGALVIVVNIAMRILAPQQ